MIKISRTTAPYLCVLILISICVCLCVDVCLFEDLFSDGLRLRSG